MGLLNGLVGHGSDVDPALLEKELDGALAPGETVEAAFRVLRDLELRIWVSGRPEPI